MVVQAGGFALYVGALALAPLSLVQATAAGGIGILAVMVARLGWRLSHPPPALPPLPPWESRLAHAVHALIYVALFVQPLSGYLGSVFSG